MKGVMGAKEKRNAAGDRRIHQECKSKFHPAKGMNEADEEFCQAAG